MKKKYEKMIEKLRIAGISCIINCDIFPASKNGVEGSLNKKGNYFLKNIEKIELRNPNKSIITGCLFDSLEK
jgi:hypothetical protein